MYSPSEAPKAPLPWETPEQPRRKVPVWLLVLGAFVLGVVVGGALMQPRSDGRSFVATAIFGVASNKVTINEGQSKPETGK
jgi:hypothetical protein